MSPLEKIKKLAEAAEQETADGGLRGAACVAYFQAVPPGTTLKLLQMIEILRVGIEEAHATWEDDNTPATCHSLACRALCRADEIENSLEKI